MNFVYNFNIFKGICFIVFFFLISETIFAQETKARVTVTATANDNIEAKNLALRSAIEQAFGAYISSSTEILNDQLIKDEIISISTGNIDSIHVISEETLSDGRTSITLLAVVSVNKLVTFCESKGYKVEFKGGLFSANLKQQKLNESAELLAVENICNVGKSIINRSFDYNLTVSQPQQDNSSGTEMWNLIYDVKVEPNANFAEFKSYVFENISKISMKSDERENYQTLNKKVFNVKWQDPSRNIDTNLYFRKIQSLALIQDLFWHSKFSLGFFEIASNLDTFDIYNEQLFPRKHVYRSEYDEAIRPKIVFHTLENEFLVRGASIPSMSENFGIGKIYSLRANFYYRNLADLEWEKKEALNYSELPPQIKSRIERYSKNIVNFYKDKYIFVMQDDNSRGVFEDLWKSGVYMDERHYLNVYFRIDLNYSGHFLFSRAFTLNEIERMTKIEVISAGTTLGL